MKNTPRVWRRGDGWVQYNPPKHHPCYEEWMKQREKEKQNDAEAIQDR